MMKSLKRQNVFSLLPGLRSVSAGLAMCFAVSSARAQTFMTANPYFGLRLGTPAPSAATSHEVTFKISTGELEASLVQVVYPNAFTFNGFLSLGSANTLVGTLTIKADIPAVNPAYLIPVRSLDNTTAYGDADHDDVYTPGTDPLLDYARFRSTQTLTISLPLGGDASAMTTTVLADLRLSAFFLDGLLTNPALPGTYTAAAHVISVDPDTDDLDDSVGGAPQIFDTQISLTIGGTSLCSTGPSLRCLEADKAGFAIQKGATDDKDKLKWSWGKGDLFFQGATGDLASTTDYALCVYDGSGGLATLRMEVAVGPGSSWESKDPKGWKYKDKTGAANGVTKALLKPGSAGKASIKIGGKGTNLPMPTQVGGGKFFDSAPNVIVQLVNTEGRCWSSEFTTPTKNETDKFQAKSKAP